MLEQEPEINGTTIKVEYWQKAASSVASGACVELGRISDGDPAQAIAGIAMRNDRDPSGPVIVMGEKELSDLLISARDGEFNVLLQE